MLKLYIIGICILFIAIIANYIATIIGLLSWYDFIELLTNNGTKAFKKVSVFDYLWLFLVYPLMLSLGYVLGNKIVTIIF